MGGAVRVAMLLGNPYTHDARVEREARTLAAMGFEVTVWCPAGEGLPPREVRDGVAVVRVPMPGWLRWTGVRRLVPLARWYSRFDFLARAAEETRPAVVHGHDLDTLLPAASLAARLGVPFVHDDHEVGLEKMRVQTPASVRGFKRWLLDLVTDRLVARGEAIQRATFPAAAAVITVSEGCASMLTPYGARPVVLRNLPSWVDLPADPRLRERAGLPPTAKVALCQGTMTEATAPEACVSAARFLPEAWAVVFLGATWMRPALEEQAAREGVADRVKFLDRVPPSELPGFTRAADVGLTPVRVLNRSERNGLSNKLFEYLHAGIPCVTTEGTAQAEFVREVGGGEVIKDFEPQTIAEAILRLAAAAPAEARARSHRLRSLARSTYCWEHESAKLEGTYRGLVGAPGRPASAGSPKRFRVAMLLGNPFIHDGRVRREARVLAGMGHEVTVWCIAREGLPRRETQGGVSVVRVPAPSWLSWSGLRRIVPLMRWYSRYEFLARAAEPSRPDIVHAHDLEMLLPAASLAARQAAPLVYDDHELGIEKLGQGSETLLVGWRHWADSAFVWHLRRTGLSLERRLIPAAAAVFSPSPSCSRVLRERYGREVVSLLNCPSRSDLPPDPRLRSLAGLPPDARVVLYQGGVTPGGGGQQCVSAARDFPAGWYLVFLGVSWMRHRLEEQVRSESLESRVRFLDAVPQDVLPGFTRAADIGLSPIRPVNLGQKYSLANKVFEYMHAGIPQVASDIPDQAELIRECDGGIIIPEVTPALVADAVRRLAEVPEGRRAADRERLRSLARSRYCWEKEAVKLEEAYRKLVESRERESRPQNR